MYTYMQVYIYFHSVLGNGSCNKFQGVSVAAFIQMNASGVLLMNRVGAHACRRKLEATLEHPWALTVTLHGKMRVSNSQSLFQLFISDVREWLVSSL